MDKRTRWALKASIATIVFCAARGASADITVTGSVLPSGHSDPWVITDILRIGHDMGDSGDTMGEVLVSNGGTLVTNGVSVGFSKDIDADFHGTVKVTDYGSTWTNYGKIAIGARRFNFGRVEVRHGARVTTDDISLGAVNYACGEMVIDGYDTSVTSTGTVEIGHSECYGLVALTQGASFFTNNVRVHHLLQLLR